MRVISWFSCGAASAYATYLAKQKYGDVRAVYCSVRNEHPDSMRFLRDFEEKTGIYIEIIENSQFEGDIYKVFTHYKYLKNQYGAPCTLHLKKNMRKKYQRDDDIQVFGYTSDERNRVDRFIDANNEVDADFILLDQDKSKQDCKDFIQTLGIELPMMYQLGYANNNCIGCVKGGMGYWNQIRKDFPEQFERMAKMERTLGYALLKDKDGMVFLDELSPDRGNFKKDMPGDCGFTCELTEQIKLL